MGTFWTSRGAALVKRCVHAASTDLGQHARERNASCWGHACMHAEQGLSKDGTAGH